MPTPPLPVGMTLQLLGPIQAFVDGEPLPPVRSRKVLWALALLVLRAGRPASRDWLAGTLWPDAPREVALANLRPVISDLRQALGAQGRRLETPERGTLLFNLEDAEIDVTTFDRLVKSSDREDLLTAVDLYRGALLEGCAEEWVDQERGVREEEFVQALQRLGEMALATADFEEATKLFRRAVGTDPWRDSPRRGLMEALSRGGDTNAALHTYREFADFLRSNANSIPDKETEELYVRLRRESRKPVEPAPAPAEAGYLPHLLTEIVGRQDEREEVAAALRQSRLVTLTGTGGIGKTRLALAVASDLVAPDGVWFVALESLADGSPIEGQIAALLGLREKAGNSALESLTEALRKKRIVLVFDNCEHVLISSGAVASHLLRECRGLRILATSREALGIVGELVWAVPPLATPQPEVLPKGIATMQRVLMGYESVELFVERARALNRNFTLTGTNAFQIAQLCAGLEGIPLAIELVAARTKSMTVEGILTRLNDHLGLTASGLRAASPRQQTLRATLDWSYALLAENERRLLRQLSVFVGGWTLEAAQAVCTDEEVDRLLTQLVDKSLVQFEEGRYRMLEMVRQYATEKLENPEELQGSHQAWFAGLAKEAEPHLRSANKTEWLRRLKDEYANLLAAIEFAGKDGVVNLQIAGSFWQYWHLRGDYVEGTAILSRCFDRHPEITPGRVQMLLGFGIIRFRQGNLTESRSTLEEALRLSREIDYRKGTASALGGLASLARAFGETELGTRLTEECVKVREEIGDRQGVAQALADLGVGLFDRGELSEARKVFQRSARIFEEFHDEYLTAWALNYCGAIDDCEGHFESAISTFERCLAVSKGLGDKRSIALTTINLGEANKRMGQFEEAERFLTDGVTQVEALGDIRNMLLGLAELAELDLIAGRFDAVREKAERIRKVGKEAGLEQATTPALQVLANLEIAEGNLPAAKPYLQECLDRLAKGDQRKDLPVILVSTATYAFHLGDFETSTRLLSSATALWRSFNLWIPAHHWTTIENLSVELQAHLGQPTFDQTWELGSSQTWPQSLAEARDALSS